MQHMEAFFRRIKVDRIRCAPFVETSPTSAALSKYFVSSRATWERLPAVIIVSKNDLDKTKKLRRQRGVCVKDIPQWWAKDNPLEDEICKNSAVRHFAAYDHHGYAIFQPALQKSHNGGVQPRASQLFHQTYAAYTVECAGHIGAIKPHSVTVVEKPQPV